jgi:hypothetical protein
MKGNGYSKFPDPTTGIEILESLFLLANFMIESNAKYNLYLFFSIVSLLLELYAQS